MKDPDKIEHEKYQSNLYLKYLLFKHYNMHIFIL